jgi:beta-glucanase (GH16 family)
MKKYFSKFGLQVLKYEAQNFILQTKMAALVALGKKFDGSRRDLAKKGYELTFQDDFDSLDNNKWQNYSYNGYRYSIDAIEKKHEAPLQYASENCLSVENSILKLKTEYNPIGIHHIGYDGTDYGFWTIPFQYGEIESCKSFKQKEGYFEIRCKIPDSINMWPAFWLCSTEKWPPEIDIFEVFTNDKFKIATTTVHWIENGKKDCSGGRYKTPLLNKDFHVWGCDWNSDTIKIYFDGILVRVTPTPPDYIYGMHIIINSGANNPMGDYKMNLPNYLEVDYVRSYKKIN